MFSIIISRAETNMAFCSIYRLNNTVTFTTSILKNYNLIWSQWTDWYMVVTDVCFHPPWSLYLHWMASIGLFTPMSGETSLAFAMVVRWIFHGTYFFLKSFTTCWFSFITNRVSNAFTTIKTCFVVITWSTSFAQRTYEIKIYRRSI